MTENPYYRLLALIRAQQTPNESRFFTAKLQQLAPAVFAAGDARVTPRLQSAGLKLSARDVGADFLLLWLEGQTVLLCRLEASDER